MLLSAHDTVAVCYPIYGFCVPHIMRDFVEKYCATLAEKKLIFLCTQMMFSGDGTRAFARLSPGCDGNVLCAGHFNMPNNISSFRLFPVRASADASKLQNTYWLTIEEKQAGSFLADGAYNRCGLCVRSCPVRNLELSEKGVMQKNSCILCYRCVNLCPPKGSDGDAAYQAKR